MSDVLKLQYGSLANMPIAKTNGQFLVAKDVEKAFVDLDGVRIPLTDIVTGHTQTQILAITSANALPKLYLSSDTLLLFYFDASANEGAGEWRQVGGAVEKATKDGDGNVITTTYQTVTQAAADYAALETLIAGINSFEVQIVDSVANLPATGATNVIYFVPANAIDTSSTGDKNVYDEYMWVLKTPAVVDPVTEEETTPAVYAYEHIGTTETDLTNYYTKTETDAIETALYNALGFTKSAAAASDFTTVSARFTADEAAIAELDAKLGDMADSTDVGFSSVEARLSATEANDAELAAQLGNLDSTATGYQTVAERLTALESDTTDASAITEINAKLGAYPDSTDTDFVSVADRFTADEADITEINAKLGAMADSTDVGFSSVEARLSAEETATSRLDAELGTLDSTAANYKTVAERLTTTEANDAELAAQLGNLDSTVANYKTVAERLTTTEANDAELAAQLGNLDSTSTGYVSVADRLTALESDTTDASAITEINAKLGNYADSTDTGFVSVEDRFSADEADITELKAKFGTYAASTASGFTTVESRFTTDESAITELAAKIGVNYPASTDTGFKSIDTRLSELVTSIGNINKFDIVVIPANGSLPATGELYTIYFVPVAPGADNNNGQTKYVEYMWVADATLTAGGYYEEIGITEADLSEYYTSAQVDAIIGTDDVTAGTIRYRIATNETNIATNASDIDELQAQLGAYPASTDTDFVSVAARFTADEADIAEINAKLGNMAASTDTGFASVEARLAAIEAGALNQTEDTANAEKPVLVSGDNNHNTVEYVSNITVNASAGSVTANSIVLGGATLTFDSVNGALVVNF